MNVLLIDADSTIPNIALMKISTYHKQLGDTVSIVKLGLPYYPHRNRKQYIAPDNFDKIYCSVIFKGNYNYITGKNIIFGGTGYDIKKNLPDEIEKCNPDYSIYPENNTSYGFLTRGCIRKCYFCCVPEKEGIIRRYSSIEDIVCHKKVKFLDNNILAYQQHKTILNELIRLNIKCSFNQGLDIRLLDRSNSSLLSQLNYDGEYIFAFDNWGDKKIIEEKLALLHWAKPYQLKFYVYVSPAMPISDTIKRINFLKEKKCLPYVMRDISCWDDINNHFYVDIAAYCNQVSLFKKLDFYTFLKKRHKNLNRIEMSYKVWCDNESNN